MLDPDDTIVAIATPVGRGGIGVVRLSGPGALDIASHLVSGGSGLEPRRATLATIRGAGPSGGGRVADEAIVTWFPAPHSYTGQHVVEISAHGSPVILEGIVRGAVSAGARLARRGEFTLRAFLCGNRDLVQAEAVADLVDAATDLQAETAFDQLQGTLTGRIRELDDALLELLAQLEASLDFPDEGHHFISATQTGAHLQSLISRIDALLVDSARGRLIREGATVVVVGRTNVGKSSVFNVLCGFDRAIVTDVAGTTRDLVTERVDLCGMSITLVDTAGARETDDIVEREGVRRGAGARHAADLVLVVVDGSVALSAEDRAVLGETTELRRLVVVNKSDLPTLVDSGQLPPDVVHLSAKTGAGRSELCAAISEALTGSPSREPAALSNVRHIDLLRDARISLADAVAAAQSGASEEFVVADVQRARRHLTAILGAGVGDDVLARIFERFCIGK